MVISLRDAKRVLENAKLDERPLFLKGREMYRKKFKLGGVEHRISIDWIIEDIDYKPDYIYYINDKGYFIGYYDIQIVNTKPFKYKNIRVDRTAVADFRLGYNNITVSVLEWDPYFPEPEMRTEDPDYACHFSTTLWVEGFNSLFMAIDDASFSFEIKEGNATKEIVINDIMPPLRSREFVEQLGRTDKKYERMKRDPLEYLRNFDDYNMRFDFVDTELLRSEIKWISHNTRHSIDELYMYYLSSRAGKYSDVDYPRKDIELFFMLDHFRENCTKDLPKAIFYFLVLSSNILNVPEWRRSLGNYTMYVTESDLMNAIGSTDVNLKIGAIRYIGLFPNPALISKVKPFINIDRHYDDFVEHILTDSNYISDIPLILDLFSVYFVKRRRSFSNLDLYPYQLFTEFLLENPKTRIKEMLQSSVSGNDSIKTTAVIFYTLVTLYDEFERSTTLDDWEPLGFLEAQTCFEDAKSIIVKRFENGLALDKRFIKCFKRHRKTPSVIHRWISCAFTLARSKDYPLLIKETLDHLSF